MVRPESLRQALFPLLLLFVGCGEAPTSTVILRFVPGDVEPRPDYLLVTWMGGEDIAFRDQRLPRAGRLQQSGPELGTLSVQIDPTRTSDRTVLARAFRDAMQVGIAAARVHGSQVQHREIVLALSASLPDLDGDGVPDVIDDDCDGTSPLAACRGPRGDAGLVPDDPATVGVDATTRDTSGAQPDGSAAPNLLDAAPPDAAPPDAAAADSPAVDAPPADGPAADAPARDLAPPDAALPDAQIPDLATPDTARDLSPYACPCSLWPSSVVPTYTLSNDVVQPLELAVRFSSEVDGQIEGLRFFKVPEDSGVHTASLWTGSGALLATATYTNESASGWQQVMLPSPIKITAGSPYVASYHTTSGQFATSYNYFDAAGLDRPPLHAPRDQDPNRNGLFVRDTGVFPWQAGYRNYWADVVFVP